MKRYNAMREVSGDPRSGELLKVATNMFSQAAAGRQSGLRDLLGSLQHDFSRYVAMRSM